MARQNDATNLWAIIEVLEMNGSALRGLSFSITGHLGLPRGQIVKIIESAGGTFNAQPDYGTRYIVTNKDWNANSTVTAKASSKLIKAQQRGIKIISENEFCQMVIDRNEKASAAKESA